MNDIHRTVKVIPWQESWEETFRQEKENLITAIESAGLRADVYHVGSTSLKGMDSKPIIDILVCPAEDFSLEAYLPVLEKVGYENLGECGRDGRYFFSKGTEENKAFYLHLCYEDHEVAQDQLLFQNIERNDPGVSEDYIRLKYLLAHEYPDDRDSYRHVKGWYIHSVLEAYRLGEKDALNEQNTEDDDRIKYWIYEFDMPEEKKKEIEEFCTLHELTIDEFAEAAVRHFIDREKSDPEGLRKDMEEMEKDSEIRLIRCYPVYKGETEAQALKRTLAEEARDKLKEEKTDERENADDTGIRRKGSAGQKDRR